MNAVEIEEAVSNLAEQPFDAESFPYAFLEAFANKVTTIQRLKGGGTNQSDLGGVLHRNNIHIKVCPEESVAATLKALRESPRTTSQKRSSSSPRMGNPSKPKTIIDGGTVACSYPDFHDHFGFFLLLDTAAEKATGEVREDAVEYHTGVPADEAPSDDELASVLRGEDLPANEISQLKHVRSREEIRLAEEVAQRNPCKISMHSDPASRMSSAG